MKKFWVIFAIIIFVSGCATLSKLQPRQEDLLIMQQKVPGITMEKVTEGYMLYKNKCSGCHGLHSPAEHTITEWNKTMEEMFPKAKISDEASKTLIRDYLYAKSK